MKNNPRLLRITTVPISLKILLEGQFAFFRQQGFEVLTASADGLEVLDLKKEGTEHVVIPMTRAITPLRDLYCLFKLIALIGKFKPDIVHTHTPKAGLLGMMAAWICRVPIRLHTVAGLPVMEARGLKRSLLLVTERLTIACARKVFPNSRGLLEYMALTFPQQQSKFSIVGKGSSNGIDGEYFSRTNELEEKAVKIRERLVTKNEIVFSFVGRLVRDKGIVELVLAFQELKFPCRLLLIGNFEQDLDPLPENVMNFLKQDSRVLLSGFQQDVRPWIIASDVFVFPSYREGFPNGVMQAACLEVPVIASDINGCNEIIQHQKTGILVPPKESDSLGRAMTVMATDYSTRKEWGKLSRSFVIQNFGRRYVWSEILKEYNEALISRGK